MKDNKNIKKQEGKGEKLEAGISEDVVKNIVRSPRVKKDKSPYFVK